MNCVKPAVAALAFLCLNLPLAFGQSLEIQNAKEPHLSVDLADSSHVVLVCTRTLEAATFEVYVSQDGGLSFTLSDWDPLLQLAFYTAADWPHATASGHTPLHAILSTQPHSNSAYLPQPCGTSSHHRPPSKRSPDPHLHHIRQTHAHQHQNPLPTEHHSLATGHLPSGNHHPKRQKHTNTFAPLTITLIFALSKGY